MRLILFIIGLYAIFGGVTLLLHLIVSWPVVACTLVGFLAGSWGSRLDGDLR